MSFTAVGTPAGAEAGNGLSVTVSYTVQGVGNLIVVGGWCYNNTSGAGALTLTFSDNGSTPNSYTSCGTPDYDGLHITAGMAYAIAQAASTITFKMQPSSTAYCSIALAEYGFTGGTTVAVDGYAAAHGASGSTSISSGNLTTTGASDLLASIEHNAQSTRTAGTGWTKEVDLTTTADEPGGYEDQLNVAAGTYAGTWTIASSAYWQVVACGFKVTSGGGGASPYFPGSSILRPLSLSTVDLYRYLD